MQFGHTVGQGLQDIFCGLSETQIIWKAFTGWKIDLGLRDDKRAKDFYRAVFAIQKLLHARNNGYLKDWEIVEFNGSPAVELGFIVHLQNGFKYRGFVDLVLRNRETNKILVIDGKTTWFRTVNGAEYKNSFQALGYSIVLEVIFPDLMDYNVSYLVYKTTEKEWEMFDFVKSFSERAEWIQTLVLECEEISRYAETGVFPKHGESCKSFGRECEYFQYCGMKTEHLVKPLTQEKIAAIELENKSYAISVSIDQLIESQIRKSKS